ncbi:MAG: hypothetical protein ORN85_01435 [Sediminibacterium sp.]|nr:hypothetical protein [Sediminibacterium sp.]
MIVIRNNKIILLSYMFCFFLHNCLAQTGQSDFDTVLFLNTHEIHINSIREDEYKKAAQTERFIIDNSRIKKNKDKLVLNLTENIKVVLRDSLSNSDNTEQVTYNYIGHFKEVGLYVIIVQYYESVEFLLINDKTGVKTKIWGEPKLSSDNKHIVCSSNAIGYDIMPNGIQMWLIEKDNLILEWVYKQEQWGVDGIIWVKENCFYFIKHIPDFISKTKKEEKHYAKISFY